MKAAKSVFFLWISGMNPFFASSASRRSLIAISVGNFMSTPPSLVGKVCAASPSTTPPDTTPPMREQQPYGLNARLIARKSVGEGRSDSVRVDLGGRRLIKKKHYSNTQ